MDSTALISKPCIQIIDPDMTFRRALEAYLLQCGYQVSSCGDLETSLRQAAEMAFDVIVIDPLCYEADVLDILRLFQSSDNHPCIVLMAPQPGTEMVRSAMREGAFDFLSKPLDPAQVEKSLVAGLENRRTFLEVFHLSRELQEVNHRLQEANRQLNEQKNLLEAERDQLREWARELNALNEFSSAICSTLDFEEIISLITTELPKLISYDLCALILFDKPQVQIYFHATLPIAHQILEHIVEDFLAISPTLLDHQVSKTEIVYELAGRMEFTMHVEEIEGIKEAPASISESLTVARETIGLINLYRFASESFSSTQRRLLSTLSNQVALALKNAREYQKTQELSLRDGLTHLYNHIAFQHFLEREFEAFLRYNRPIALIMMDIDYFKMVNDQHGHQAGDYILREVAALSLGCVRKVDLLARYGGEEFAIILPNTDLSQANVLARRLRQKIQDHRFTYNGETIRVTVSLGVASTSHAEVNSPESLIRRADSALYQAKEGGRNQVCLVNSGLCEVVSTDGAFHPMATA